MGYSKHVMIILLKINQNINFRPQEDVFCFLAGDSRYCHFLSLSLFCLASLKNKTLTFLFRVNEQTVLAMVHLLFVREHNRIAVELSKINPHWNDETIFQVEIMR